MNLFNIAACLPCIFPTKKEESRLNSFGSFQKLKKSSKKSLPEKSLSESVEKCQSIHNLIEEIADIRENQKTPVLTLRDHVSPIDSNQIKKETEMRSLTCQNSENSADTPLNSIHGKSKKRTCFSLGRRPITRNVSAGSEEEKQKARKTRQRVVLSISSYCSKNSNGPSPGGMLAVVLCQLVQCSVWSSYEFAGLSLLFFWLKKGQKVISVGQNNTFFSAKSKQSKETSFFTCENGVSPLFENCLKKSKSQNQFLKELEEEKEEWNSFLSFESAMESERDFGKRKSFSKEKNTEFSSLINPENLESYSLLKDFLLEKLEPFYSKLSLFFEEDSALWDPAFESEQEMNGKMEFRHEFMHREDPRLPCALPESSSFFIDTIKLRGCFSCKISLKNLKGILGSGTGRSGFPSNLERSKNGCFRADFFKIKRVCGIGEPKWKRNALENKMEGVFEEKMVGIHFKMTQIVFEYLRVVSEEENPLEKSLILLDRSLPKLTSKRQTREEIKGQIIARFIRFSWQKKDFEDPKKGDNALVEIGSQMVFGVPHEGSDEVVDFLVDYYKETFRQILQKE